MSFQSYESNVGAGLRWVHCGLGRESRSIHVLLAFRTSACVLVPCPDFVLSRVFILFCDPNQTHQFPRHYVCGCVPYIVNDWIKGIVMIVVGYILYGCGFRDSEGSW